MNVLALPKRQPRRLAAFVEAERVEVEFFASLDPGEQAEWRAGHAVDGGPPRDLVVDVRGLSPARAQLARFVAWRDRVRAQLAQLNGQCAYLETMRDGRINMPDVYRVGFGLLRKGGTKPVASG